MGGSSSKNKNNDNEDSSNNDESTQVFQQHINANRYASIPVSGNWNNLLNIALQNKGDKYNLPEFRYTLGASELERKLRDPEWWKTDDQGKFINNEPVKINPEDTVSLDLLKGNGTGAGPTEWTPGNAYHLFDGLAGIEPKTLDGGQKVISGKCIDNADNYVDCADGVYVPGCPVAYTSSYRCGDSSKYKTINLSNKGTGSWLKTAVYDCNAENQKCLDVRLVLLDTGILQIQQGENFYNINNEKIPDTAIEMSQYKADKGKFKNNYLVPGEILTAVDDLANIGDNFLGSPNGRCRLVLYRNVDKFQFLIMYSVYNCEKNSLNNYIGLDATDTDTGVSDLAVYTLPKVDTAQVGQVGYITNDLQLRQYPSGMVKKGGKEYFSVGNYSSSDELATLSNVSLSDCKNECNKNNKCYGFSYNKTAKTATLYGENMYGVNTNGKRIFNEDLELFIRSKIIDNNDSCNKEVNSITGVEWNAYNKGDVMSKDTLCQVADYIENQRQIAEKEGEKLKNIGKEMKSKLTKLTNEEKKLVNNMGFNVDKLSKQLTDYNDTQYSLEHADKHNANLSAMNEDTNLRMQSENYQYLLWSILAILIIIYGIRSSRS